VTWWDWGLPGWLTTLLQCFDMAGWVIRPVKHRLQNDLNCVDWDVKPCSTQLQWLNNRKYWQLNLQHVGQHKLYLFDTYLTSNIRSLKILSNNITMHYFIPKFYTNSRFIPLWRLKQTFCGQIQWYIWAWSTSGSVCPQSLLQPLDRVWNFVLLSNINATTTAQKLPYESHKFSFRDLT